MAHRPAKRQRRAAPIPPDEEEDVIGSRLPVRSPKAQRQLELNHGGESRLALSPTSTKTAKSKQPSKKPTFKDSPKSSPEKRKKTQKQESDQSTSIQSFFGKVTEEQRWHRKSVTPDIEIEDGELGDAIEDDLSDDALLEIEASKNVVERHKNITNNLKVNGAPPVSSQRFVKPAAPLQKNDSTGSVRQDQEYHRPWSDRYGPTNLDELAVHKKKVSDVSTWLENVLAGRDKHKLLLLKGPAGSGKTTTVTLLSRSIGFQLVPWQNPTSYDSSTSGSILNQFDDFLNRGGQFSSLSLQDDQPTSTSHQPQVMLIEEFPAIMSRSTGQDSLRKVIMQLLARAQALAAPTFRAPPSQTDGSPPVILVVSETLLSSSTSFSDSFTAHRLLGPEILNHPLVTVMEFNPVAPTFIHKAIDLVIKKEARESKRRRMPGAAVLSRLAEMGDVRNAVNTLEFLCVRSDGDWSGTVASKTKKSSKDGSMTDMERDSLQLVSQRETTLDMFHAAGKVVYNKRDDPRVLDTRAQPPPKPPDHLMYLYTPKISQVDIEALLNETGTDIQTFISTLHENYALSCNGDSFVDCLDGCADSLSTSDVLNPESRRSLRSRTGNAATIQLLSSGSSDALRQDEISFNVATRGLLFNLPHPVNRAAPSSGRQSDKFKMFYPTSLRLWKPTEEIESLISLYSHDETLATTSTQGSGEGVASWKSSGFGQAQPPSDLHHDDADEARKITLTRDDLTLDVLPYLRRIRLAQKQDVKMLNRITKFNGSIVQTAGDEPDEEQPKEEIIVGREKPGSNHKTIPKSGSSNDQMNEATDHLFLQDDDIEDD